MKTKERHVIVEVTENGKKRRYYYPIATRNGELMTHRLLRLMSGKIGRSSAAPHENPREVHYVGMTWSRPCVILKELEDEWAILTAELASLKRDPVCGELKCYADDGSTDDEISRAVREHLEVRQRLKRQIAEGRRELATGRA